MQEEEKALEEAVAEPANGTAEEESAEEEAPEEDTEAMEEDTMGDDTEGQSASAGGACEGQDGWDRDFAHRMYDCAVKTGVNPRKGGRCMAKKQHVSYACGSCMGKYMKCSVKCASKCCNGKCLHSSKCRSCTASKCDRSFFRCAGVHAP